MTVSIQNILQLNKYKFTLIIQIGNYKKKKKRMKIFSLNILIDPVAHRSKPYSSHKPKLSSMKRQDTSSSRDRSGSPASSTIATSSPIAHQSDEPVVSERAGYGDHNSDEDDARRVQFSRKNGSKAVASVAEVIDLSDNDSYDDDQQSDDHRKRKG